MKNLEKVTSFITMFALVIGLVPMKSRAAEVITTTDNNPMIHFVMQVRWGNVIGEPTNDAEANFDGSVAVSSNARINLEKTLLFEKHNDVADKITSKKDPVSWNSLIYNHWDGIRVLISSPANDSIAIKAGNGENNTITKTAQELYDMKGKFVQDVGDGREIVVKVYPISRHPNYFLKVFWGKVEREDYVASIKKCREKERKAIKCLLLPLINADGSFKIDSGGKLSLVKTLRFEKNDKITSKSDTQIDWTSSLYGGIDGILVNLKLDASELDKSDTVTLSFTNSNWTKSFSIVDLYHNGITKETIKNGYGVVLQVWKRTNRSLIRVKNKPTVYMIEDGIKQPIPSEEVLSSQGMTFDDVEVVEQEEADTYADGDAVNYADGTIVQEEGKPEVYVIENGEKKHIESPKAFEELGYKWKNIVRVRRGILSLYGNGNPMKAKSIHPEGALVRVAGTPTVYVIKGGKRVPISSIQLFNAYRFDWNKVLVINKGQLNKFKKGNILEYPDGSLLRDKKGKIYKIDHGKKRWIRSGDDFAKAGYKENKVLNVDDTEINSFEGGEDIVADDVTE